ncbi:MAG: DUF2934 domain-containing protein [Gammaproteobacteria bacterium]|nr:DUF2934 domain-containing protein [Gammaproteobacteria bacterium]
MNKPDVNNSQEVESLIGVNVQNSEELREMVAREAYLLAEKRGFKDGDPVQDWLEAEKKVIGMIYFMDE